MTILDKSNFLSKSEKEKYILLLKKYKFSPDDFLLKVVEDQNPMDMNDLSYVIELKIKVIYAKTNATRTYMSAEGSGVWLTELEEDLLGEVF